MNSLITHSRPRQKFVLQSIALVTLGALFIPVWNTLKKVHVSDLDVASVPRASDPLSGLLGDLYLLLSVSLLAILLGVMCAFYLEEWLSETNWVRRLVESQVDFLTGVPSLLYGLLGVAVFLPYSGVFGTMETPLAAGEPRTVSSKIGAFQGDTTLFYATVLTFVLLVMPRAVKTTQEALRSVPVPIRESAYALGANRWQVLTKHVVPLVLPRVIAGGCRAMSCVLAAAALFTGICMWGPTAHAEQTPDTFALFLTAALFSSLFSSFLLQRFSHVSMHHT